MSPDPETVARRAGLDPSQVLTRVDRTSLRMWNAVPSARPSVVVRCNDTTDVQAAVRMSTELALAPSVYSGGNDWAGRAVREGGLVIDVSALTAIEVDADARTARLGGGVRSDVLTRETEAVGLTPVAGTVGSVHMLGLLLGGGYGPLNGRFGLASDNLVAAEVVTPDGEITRVDADTDPELFWALRGGGGNFGVVTSAVVRLHEVGPVHTGTVVYPWSQAASVLDGLDRLLADCPDELSLQTIVASTADNEPVVMVLPTWSGPAANGPAAVDPVERLGDPLAVSLGPSPLHSVMSSISTSFPPGRHIRIRTRNVARFSPPVIERLTAAGTSRSSPLSALSIHPFHGAATRVPVDETAFGERRPHQMVEVVGVWEAGDELGANDAAWADEVHASLAGESMTGGYANLLAADDEDQIREAYGPHADRLLAVKKRIDPTRLFSATPLPGGGRQDT